MNFTIKAYRRISIFEGVSFLVLLGIAMPLKYIWNYPEMVQIVGMAHGILFIAYIFGTFIMYQKLNWKLQTLAIVITCSIVPLGPFYAKRKYLL